MDLFPTGIAYGDAFYDREQERRELKKAIDHGQHTVMIAPRRFGKTSLIRKVVDENKYPHVWVDLMAFTCREEATRQIIKHVGDLVIQIGKTEDKIKSLLAKFLGFLKPQLSVDIASSIKFKLQFASEEIQNTTTITQVLLTLDQIAQHSEQRVVFVFDEFQEIVQFEEHTNAFQGAIRHAVERAKQVTYIFSGSKHEALRTLFTGKKNPLYELCQLLPLSLIDRAYYQSYLQKESKKRWEQPLNDSLIERILTHTECYPKYVNALCLALWTSSKKPSIALIDKLWEIFLFTRKSSIRDELASLKMSERRLLRAICFQPTATPTSIDYANYSQVPPATATRSIKELVLKDFLYRDDNGTYRPIDPTYLAYFQLFG